MAKLNDVLEALPRSTRWKIKNFEFLKGMLATHYDVPLRYYHNLDHIFYMLNKLSHHMRPKVHPRDIDEIAVAILFHDLVYDFRAKNGENERNSATIARFHGPQMFDGIVWSEVSHLILATTHEGGIPDTEHSRQFMCDLDLATFAADYETFHDASLRIVREYENIYPTMDVIEGRMQFLTVWALREKIFYTETFSNQIAHENIQREFAWLEAYKQQELEAGSRK
jgi:predicted metal-dependent HD superfamily phosphohydrolase